MDIKKRRREGKERRGEDYIKNIKYKKMQIFLPYTDIIEVADCLDKRRLHKQIVECKQIIQAIIGISDSWKNHPIVKMYSNDLEFVNLYSIILEKYWNLSKEEDFSQIKTDLKKGKDFKNFYLAPNLFSCKYINPEVLTLLELNKKIKIPNFISTYFGNIYLYTMRGRLYIKDPIYYSSFSCFKNYGEYNMYFVDNKWKFYKQKIKK